MSRSTPLPRTIDPEARRQEVQYLTVAIGLIAAVAVLALFLMHRSDPAEAGPPADTAGPQLREALARVDHGNPRWHFGELEDDRAPVPAGENAAPIVLESVKLIPNPWRGPTAEDVRQKLRRGLIDEAPRADIEPATRALVKARELAGFRRGRYSVEWNRADPLETVLPHLPDVNNLVDVLSLDAEVRAHEHDMDGALVSARAAVVATRSIGDEPMLASQMLRLGWQHRVVETLEELMRYGSASEPKLALLQDLLLEEGSEPVLRTIVRSERAGLHGLMTSLEAGKLTRADPSLLGVRAEGVQLILNNDKLRQRESLEEIHALILDYTTQAADITDLPSQDQLAKLDELSRTILDIMPSRPAAALLLKALPLPDTGMMSLRSQALLRSAAVALAVERFRLATGQWPKKLDELRPRYLTEIPTDPFDGKPLRFIHHKDMVVIYSVGPDGKDDGGRPEDLNHFEKKDRTDVGFRLWNTEARKKGKK